MYRDDIGIRILFSKDSPCVGDRSNKRKWIVWLRRRRWKRTNIVWWASCLWRCRLCASFNTLPGIVIFGLGCRQTAADVLETTLYAFSMNTSIFVRPIGVWWMRLLSACQFMHKAHANSCLSDKVHIHPHSTATVRALCLSRSQYTHTHSAMCQYNNIFTKRLGCFVCLVHVLRMVTYFGRTKTLREYICGTRRRDVQILWWLMCCLGRWATRCLAKRCSLCSILCVCVWVRSFWLYGTPWIMYDFIVFYKYCRMMSGPGACVVYTSKARTFLYCKSTSSRLERCWADVRLYSTHPNPILICC